MHDQQHTDSNGMKKSQPLYCLMKHSNWIHIQLFKPWIFYILYMCTNITTKLIFNCIHVMQLYIMYTSRSVARQSSNAMYRNEISCSYEFTNQSNCQYVNVIVMLL